MNEIQFSNNDYTGASPLYAVASLVANGQYANGNTLENYTPADWSLYAIPLTLDATTGLYQGNFPGVPNGLYSVSIYQQIAVTPATTDTQLACGQYQQHISLATINTAIQLNGSDYTGVNPLYFVIYFPPTDQYVNQGSLEAYTVSDWPLYALPLTFDAPSGLWQGSFPAMPDGEYYVTIYEQMTSSPLPSDVVVSEGEYLQQLEPVAFTDQMQLDAIGFISDFGEPITYISCDSFNNVIDSVNIEAVVNRSPPAVVQEDGKVLADDVEICLINHPTLGRAVINKGRDKIMVSGRFGGAVTSHIVTTIASGDAGIWSLRVK